MGILRDTIREVLDKGLRATNAEINAEAIKEGLIKSPSASTDAAAVEPRVCRAGFEPLYQQLTGTLDNNGGPA